MAKLFNDARMTTATVGTGTLTLGSAVSGYLTFALAGVSNGNVVSYGIRDGANSEVGKGTYTSAGTTLTRTVTKSTNSNAAISLSGVAEVFTTARAEDLITTVAVQKFTATGTYTPTAGMVFAIVECQGPGGGGGGAAGIVGDLISGAGGASGAYSRALVTADSVGASQAVTIGTGGAGGTIGNNAGSAGSGATSVGALCTAGAGSGGGGSGGGVANGGAAGAAGTGDLAISGGKGESGPLASIATVFLPPGKGADSFFGSGGTGTSGASSVSAGVAGTGFGSGGSGGSAHNIASNTTGGAGTDGVAFITEFIAG